ncbi:protocadherin Fat 4-like [Branchiostoma floridae]|uniref:Protocadherin Fat 4-like n=1 Tax=Branchiostoma floridae TaxID=7739 RepID=A0A9J7L6B0_BRAFL|nr:protocadherin Fat 4-like [Branchiostoma floridae]
MAAMWRTTIILLAFFGTSAQAASPDFGASLPSTDTINENVGGGVSVYDFTVTDGDTQSVTLSIQNSNPAGAPFEVTVANYNAGTTTGRVSSTASASFDFETTTSYTLTILATDPDGNTATADLTVNIADVNEAPVISNIPSSGRTIGLNEDVGGSFQVFQVTATDVDNGDSILFSLGGGGPHFAIDSSTGIITTTPSTGIDYESGTTSYTLTVTATDTGPLTDTGVLTVNLVDTNDESPVFSGSITNPVTLSEEVPVGTSAGEVPASDADFGGTDTITYEFVSTQTDFTLDASTGVVYTAANLDYDAAGATQTWSLSIRAYDGASHSVTTTLTVNLQDLNDNSPVCSQYVFTKQLPEGTATSSNVATLSCTDSDGSSANNQLSYILSDSSGLFTLSGTEVKTSAALEYDDATAASQNWLYTMEVTVTDSGTNPTKNSATVTVVVEVTSVNENTPTCTQATYTATPNEDETVDAVIQTLSCSDNDYGDDGDLTYAIVSGNQDGKFYIHPTAGDIKLRTALDYETTPSYVLEVTATDGGGSANTATVSINVVNVNDMTPTFNPAFYTASVVETSATVGYLIATLTCADADSPDSEIQYSIISGNTAGNFRITDPDNGNPLIEVAVAIDYDAASEAQSYTLVVKAVDENGASTGLSSSAIIEVDITGNNDFTPSFAAANPTTPTIDEESQVGTSVVTFAASDSDRGADGAVTYEIINGNTAGNFEIDTSTGVVYTAKVIDYETMGNTKSYTLTVKASDGGSPVKTATQQVTIAVEDINDNAPVCTQYLYAVSLDENTAAGTAIAQLDCQDADSNTYGTVTYYEDPSSSVFVLDTTSGAVTLDNYALDYELGTTSHELKIKARDNDPVTPKTADITVTMYVNALNEFPPAFTQTIYNAGSLDEDTAIGTSVVTIVATDSDSGTDGTITYAITSPANSPFGLDSSSGLVTLVSALDYETDTNYQLTVTATDGGGRVDTATVTITVNDVNDNTPACTPSLLTTDLPEGTTTLPPYTVLTLTCSDGDGGTFGTLTYTLSQSPSTKFSITNAGVIELTSDVDFDGGETSYSLVATVTDSAAIVADRKSTTVPITVEVTSVNEGPPVFDNAPYTVSVSEATAIGTAVYTASATDPDSTADSFGQITFSITSGDSLNLFEIDSNTGEIMAKATLDREAASSHTLQLKAEDGGTQSGTTSITITLTDENDQTPECNPATYIETVSETEAVGFTVASLACTDTDDAAYGTLSYSITTGNTKLYFEMSGADLKLKKQLDYEDETTFSLSILVQDNSGNNPSNSATVPVSIYVDPSNEFTPYFSPETYSNTVFEDESVGATVVDVDAYDSDSSANAHGQITYTIQGGNSEGKFSIDDNTGEVILVDTLDRESTASYTLTVRASDGVTSGGTPNTNTTTVTITVGDANDNDPVCSPAVYTTALAEDSPAGTTVITVTCADDDDGTNANIVYSVTSTYFGIGSSSGIITVSNVPDFDAGAPSSYSLTVKAVDGGVTQRTGTALVTITLTETNDYAPAFTQTSYSASVNENEAVGTSIATAAATDSDAGNDGVIVYTMPTYTNFRLDENTGEITLKAELDYETTQSYELVVTATDQSAASADRQSASVTVYVTVNDVNDNEPSCSPATYTATIAEDTADATAIVTLVCDDLDSGVNDDLVYAITDGDGLGQFAVSTAGVVSVVKDGTDDLDFETTQTYSLEVEVTDSGVPALTTTVQVGVTLTDVNEYAPDFDPDASAVSSYSINIAENVAVGSAVMTITANDNDTAQSVTFSFNPSSNKFLIDADSGEITVKSSLDYESVTSYALKVEAVDSGSPAKTSTVDLAFSITDVNDNDPVFSPTSYAIQVQENTTNGAVVVSTTCTDVEDATVVYTMFDGNTGNVFAVDTNGDIIMQSNTNLDYETLTEYTLRVTCRDSTFPERTVTATVQIEVTGYNEDTPAFTNSALATFAADTYSATISEDSPLGDTVTQVSATDTDADADGTIYYSITSGNSEGKFYIDSSTGYIMVNKELDREATASYVLITTATDGGTSPTLSSTATVSVTVSDVNDNTPICVPSIYSNTLAESSAAGTVVANIACSDNDDGVNSQLTYTIMSGDDQGQFSVGTTGSLTIGTSLNYEDIQEYSMIIQVSDSATTPLATNVTVAVDVTGVNEFTPVFNPTSYAVNISENSTQGITVETVIATDGDFGSQGDIGYHISAGNSEQKFVIDSSSGAIGLAQTLDRETTASYQLTVLAIDDGGASALTGTTTVTVTVTDENDNTPVFAQSLYTVALDETTASGSPVVTVAATDIDEGMNADIQYSIVSGNTNNDLAIDATTGAVTLSNPLNYEVTEDYTVVIRATDMGSPANSANATLSLTVNAVNEFAPDFTQSFWSVSILENSTYGDIVATVAATDDDSYADGTVVFSITNGNGEAKFQMETTTGVIKLTANLDRENTDFYNLTVQATDMATSPLSNSSYVEVTVIDSNDNYPTFSPTVYSATVPEDQAISSTVVTVAVTDADIGTNADIAYSITAGNLEGKFGIQSNGAVTLADTLNYENTTQYTLTITATDDGYPPLSSEATVSITVGAVNEFAPVFDQDPYTASVNENATIGTVVTAVNATDDDDGTQGLVLYSIVAGNSERKWVIDEESGNISVATTLDRETTDNYELTVRAYDSYGVSPFNYTEVNVTITVLDINDNEPVFDPQTYSISILEGALVGTTVVKVTSTDLDMNANAVHDYVISAGNTGDAFELSNDEILLKNKLNHETVGLYTLTIQATDQGDPVLTGEATVTVTVLAENEFQPVFQEDSSTVVVSEDAVLGTLIYNANATDNDTGTYGNLEFYITAGNGDNGATFLCDSSTGEVRLGTYLDRETNASYVLTITVYDHDADDANTMNDTMEVTVTVSDVNDNKPTFSADQFNVFVTENVPSGSLVTTMMADDIDAGANADVVYSIVYGSSNFVIDSSTGYITTNTADLDRETQDWYYLTVKAADQGSPVLSSVVGVTIWVTDENDNTPVFNPDNYIINIEEDVAVNSAFYMLRANDADSGTNADLTYSITSGDALGQFSIATNGEVSVVSNLDRETTGQYILDVFVQDGGSPSLNATATVTVNVLDVNDNFPVFSSDPYTVSVYEDIAVGATVADVTATDADSGTNAQVSYTIIGGNEENKFVVNQADGPLLLANSLDRESNDTYNITLRAYDGGSPSLSTTVTVYVTVLDVNDNTALWTDANYTFYVSEDAAVGTSVGNISASDIDISNNADLRYSITNGDSSNQFAIVDTTGNITVNGALDREAITNYTLTVQVTDLGNPALQNSVTVLIIVNDVNDNNPIFTQTLYETQYVENSNTGLSVLTVTATDTDNGTNAAITYSISNTSTTGLSYFNIDSSTGEVTIGSSLDREADEIVTFVVLATDGGNPALTGTTTVRVNVTDLNDNPPVFNPDFYSIEIPYDSTSTEVLTTVSATDADITTNAEIIFSLVDQTEFFTLEPFSGNFKRLAGSGSLEKDVKIVARAIGRDGGTPQLSSDLGYIRVDTYDVQDACVNLTLAISCTSFSASQAAFLASLSALFSPGRAGISFTTCSTSARRRRLLQTDTTVVTIYALANNDTDSYSAIDQTKDFLTAQQVLDVLQADATTGTPNSALTTGDFNQYAITNVEEAFPTTTVSTPFYDTWYGILTIVLCSVFAVILFVLLIVLIVWCCRKNKNSKEQQKRPRRPDTPTVIENAWTDQKKTTVITDQGGYKQDSVKQTSENPLVLAAATQFQRPRRVQPDRVRKTTNNRTEVSSADPSRREFDGRAVDPATGKTYLYNTRTGARKWLDTARTNLNNKRNNNSSEA